MVEQSPHAAIGRGPEEEDEAGGIDLESVREIVSFVLRAPRRRPKVAITTFGVIAALGVTIGVTMPRTYSSQVKLLAQRSAVHVLTGQNTQMEDNPTKNVAAMIMRRDNLVALAKEANLPKRFEETRSAPLRLKDRVMAQLYGALSDQDKLDIMVHTLETKLDVTVADDSTVTIKVDWANAQLAYDLVTLVQKNFLEARYDSDVAVINDSIAILEEHAKSELSHVDTELDEYQKILNARSPKTAVVSAVAPPRVFLGGPDPRPRAGPPETGASAPMVDPDVTKALEEKRLQIRALEDARQRTIDSLTQKLSEAQLTLTPMHPTVIALQQQLASLSEPPPELSQLRSEERALMAQAAPPRPELTPPNTVVRPLAHGSPPTLAESIAPAADAGASPADALALPLAQLDRDGPLQLAQSKLALAIRAYEDALVRLDATRVELDITGAAYKHQYTVVTPAELPKSPKKATAQLVAAGAVLGGALLAILLSAGLDVLAGLILEPWQVRKRLMIEVLGELDRP